MRKVLWVFTVVAALAVLASPVFAVSLTPGGKTAKMSDFSSLYDANGNPVGLSASTFVGSGWVPNSDAAIGNTQKSVFNVTDIYPDGTNSNHDQFNSSSSTQLTGVLTDLKIVNITSNSNNTIFVLDFAPVVTPKNSNFGGCLNVYESSTKNFNQDPLGAGNLSSALHTAPGAALAIPANGAANQFTGNTFPTVTDGTLWLDAELVNLNTLQALGVVNDYVSAFNAGVAFTEGEVLRETININSGTGSGEAYAMVMNGNGDYTATAGSFDSSIDPNYLGLAGLADLTLQFDLNSAIFNATNGEWQHNLGYIGSGYWTEESQDPVHFGVLSGIPEPATLSLLGFGLVGLLARRRK